jgi:hypothetical protein
MDLSKERIIELFKKKGSEISTKEILIYVYPEYEKFKDFDDVDSKRKIAQAHRRLLYHINELVERGILRFSRFGEKGHKFFVLNINENEEITEFSSRYKKKMIISKPMMPSMPIESYEHQGIIKKFENQSWIDKLNSVVIFCKNIDNLNLLDDIFESSLAIVNDCICFEDFDEILRKIDKKQVIKFLEKISSECNDFQKKICCIINISNVRKEDLIDVVEKVIEDNMKEITFIYNLNNEDMQERFGMLSETVMHYIKKKKMFYIKNKNLYKAPYFIGSAGPYCFSETDFFEKKEPLYVAACSQSSLIIDVEKFFSLNGMDIDKFSLLMFNISRSFLSANSLQRRKSEDYFKSVSKFDKINEKEFLEFSRNYIRFWNFGISQPGINQSLVLNMINEAKKKIYEFSLAEEIIYKSCGMPTRFRIGLSCAFETSQEKLSSAKYKPLKIQGLDDLYKQKLKKELIERENVSFMFDGGNDVTFHRSGNFTSEEIIREFSIVLNSYKFPLFSYNFENLKGDAKITSYF